MSDVTGKDVVQALLKEPDLLHDTMAEITKVLGTWTQVPHPDNNEEGSVAFLRSNLSTGGDVVIVKTGFMGCWLWERVCGEGATVHPNLLKLADPDFEPVPVPSPRLSPPVVRLRPNGEGSGDDLAGLFRRSQNRLRNVAFTLLG